MKVNIRLIMILSLIVFFGGSLFFTGYVFFKNMRLEGELNNKMHGYAQRQIDDATQKLGVKFQAYTQIVCDAVKELGERQWDKASLNSFLKSRIETHVDLRGIYISFEPYKFDKSIKLYSSGYLREGKKITITDVPYDYTLSSAQAGARTEWYRDFIKTGAGWSEPYFGTVSKQHIISYASPFFSPTDKKNPLGVIEVDVLLDSVRDVVNNLALSKRSYGFVVSPKGIFIAHPKEEYYRKELSVFDIDQDQDKSVLTQINRGILRGNISFVNGLTAQQSMLYYRVIPGTKLIFEIVFIRDEFFPAQASLVKQNKNKIVLGLFISLVFFLLLMIFLFRNRYVLLIACVVSLLALGGAFTGKQIYNQRGLTNSLNNKMHEYAQQQINDVVQKMEINFQGYAQIVRDAAKELEQRVWDKESLDAFLRSKIEKNSDIYAVWAAFEPYVFDKSIRLYAPFYKRDSNKISLNLANYDYTLPSEQAGAKTEWYRNFIKTGAGWTEPYWGTGAQQNIITYSSRFFSPSDKKNPSGVVEVDISLAFVQELADKLSLSKRSYGFILSQKGAFISRPNDEYYRNKFSIFDIDKELNQNILTKNNQKILEQKNGNISYIDELTGKQSVVYFRVIPGTNLIFGIVFMKDEFFSSPAPLVKKNADKVLFGVIVCLILMLLLMMILLKSCYVRLVVGVSGLLILGVFFTGREVYNYISLGKLLNNKMQAYAQQQIDDATQKISPKFQRCVQLTTDIAKDFGMHGWTKESINSLLKSTTENNKGLAGIQVAFEPYAFDKSIRLYGPFYGTWNGKIKSYVTEQEYILPSAQAGDRTEWYTDFIRSDAGWTEPYWSFALGGDFIFYSSHFFSPSDKKNPIGVVCTGLTLDYVREVVNSLALGKRSYGFVVSKKGTFVAHPIEEIYHKGRTIFDMAKERGSDELEEIGRQMQKQESGSAPYSAAISGQRSELFYRAIPGTNLIMGIVFSKDEFFAEKASLVKHTKIKVAFGVVLSLILLILLIIIFLKNRYASLIAGAICCSIFLLGGIGYLWVIQRTHGGNRGDTRILVFDQNTINKTVAEASDLAKEIAEPIRIKTGVLFDKIEFISNTKVYLSGEIWQKYPVACDSSIARDFLLPQSKPSFQKKLISSEKNGKEEVYVWRVAGELAQEDLLSQAFPFDDQEMEVRIEHYSRNKNVLLVPDIDSYKFISPQTLPGVVKPMHIVDWILEKTFFSFNLRQNGVAFGGGKINEREQKYFLTFTVQAKRDLLGILIMYLLPLLVALFLLFLNLCITRKNSIMMSISLTSGTFLGLIFSHAAMRKVESGSTVFYLEYFYIVPYFLIIFLLIDLILYSQNRHFYFIKYHNNLLAKILFWPSFLFVMFLITGLIFW